MQEIPKKNIALIAKLLSAKSEKLPEVSKRVHEICGCLDTDDTTTVTEKISKCNAVNLYVFWKKAVEEDPQLAEFSDFVWLDYVAFHGQAKIVNAVRMKQDAAYAAMIQEQRRQAEAKQLNIPGVGTELKKLLKRVGIVASPNCQCNARAAKMNAQGIAWCEEHFEEIVGWLQDEAKSRKLPFLPVLGRQILKLAISRAKKTKAKP